MSNLLTDPKHLNIYLRSKSFEGAAELNKEDYWYKTKYGNGPFPE